MPPLADVQSASGPLSQTSILRFCHSSFLLIVAKLAPMLEAIHERLAGVVNERLPWQEFLRRYDRPEMLFYLDPPYFGVENDYGRDCFARAEFAELADRLRNLKGTFLLSINDRPEVRALFDGFALEAVSTTYSIDRGKPSKAGELIIAKPD